MSRMRILTPDGVVDVEISRFHDASTLGSYWNAVQRFLYTGETDDLELFQGARVKGQVLLTDPDEIERQAMIGELDVDDIYTEPR